MSLIVRSALFLGFLVQASIVTAADQMPWVADFRTACEMAAEQRRLVLLHFYNDNCPPCRRLDQNVFTQATVADAVGRNYIPVKVHAGKNTQLATRYRIQQWPTDVFVTPSGLEVYRTVSPQEPTAYIAVVNQIAEKTGVSIARQWSSTLTQSANTATSQVQAAAHQAAAEGQSVATNATARIENASGQLQQGFSAVTGQIQDAARGVTAAAADASHQATAAAQDIQKQATTKFEQYEQSAASAAQQVRQEASKTGQEIEQRAELATKEVQGATQQVAQGVTNAAREMRSKWQGFLPSTPNAASSVSAAPPLAAPAAAEQSAPPLMPTENPWMKIERQAAAAPQNPATAAAQSTSVQPATAQPKPSPPSPAETTSPTSNATLSLAQSPPAAAAPSVVVAGSPDPQASNRQLVLASEAPPIALDGFCPVTLLETVAKNPSDKAAWKKGNVRYGAIHRGRTYLFVSPELQEKFLANADAYAPVMSGYDPVRYAESGQLVEGRRACGMVTPDKQIILFADETSYAKYRQSPATYVPAVRQAMRAGDAATMHR